MSVFCARAKQYTWIPFKNLIFDDKSSAAVEIIFCCDFKRRVGGR